jgi:hypothetical protein
MVLALAPTSLLASTRTRLGLLAILWVQAFSAWGFWHYLDLHPSDECQYLFGGRELFAGRPDWVQFLNRSGPYSALYCGVDALVGRGVLVQDVALVLVAFSSSVALYWALLAVLPAGAAAIFGMLWATGSHMIGRQHIGVYAFAATLFFWGVGLRLRGRAGWSVLILALAAVTRMELQSWLAGWGIAALLAREQRRFGAMLLALCLALASVSSFFERDWWMWIAFGQHYGQGLGERTASEGPPSETWSPVFHPFHRPSEVLEPDFGDAASLTQGLRANPRAFGLHVLHNLSLLPGGLLEMLAPFPGQPYLGRGIALGILLLAVVGVLRLAMLWRRGDLPPPLVLSLPLLAASPLHLAIALILRPKAAYLTPLYLPLAIACACGAAALVERARPRAAATRAASEDRLLPWVAVLLVLILLVPRVLEATPRRALHWRSLVAAGWRLPSQSYGSLQDPEQIGELFPAGTRVLRYETPADDPAVERVLVSAMDLAFSARNASHAAVVDELFGSGGFELESFRDGTWTFARCP